MGEAARGTNCGDTGRIWRICTTRYGETLRTGLGMVTGDRVLRCTCSGEEPAKGDTGLPVVYRKLTIGDAPLANGDSTGLAGG
mmetsp:Transcript_42715/g.67655  ORF Transcript_42715/g.67655 Transcript_42715/m.67655 type:complete len:83 (+) Transcript_42715:157-405(+)